jgi:hypothetical protein
VLLTYSTSDDPAWLYPDIALHNERCRNAASAGGAGRIVIPLVAEMV